MRVLATKPCARSRHFAVHFLAVSPGRSSSTLSPKGLTEGLSTGSSQELGRPVDKIPGAAPAAASWLGLVVPKRHARRAVTRSLLKRQMRAAALRASMATSVSPAGLHPGLWVLRLCAPFAPQAFPSAASDALRDAARPELDDLLDRAVRRVGTGVAAAGATSSSVVAPSA